MSEIAATVVAAPSFVAAVEGFEAFTVAQQTGDKRTKAHREAVNAASRPAERAMRRVAAESGVGIAAVQAVVMAAARVARDQRAIQAAIDA